MNVPFPNSEESRVSEASHSNAQKGRNWKTKAAVTLGVGVPLGLVAMADTAAASPEAHGSYADNSTYDMPSSSFDTPSFNNPTSSNLSFDTASFGTPAASPSTFDDGGFSFDSTSSSSLEFTTPGTGGQTFDTRAIDAQTLDLGGFNTSAASGNGTESSGLDSSNIPSDQSLPVEVLASAAPEPTSAAQTQRTPTASTGDTAKFRGTSTSRGEFNQPATDPGGSRFDFKLEGGQNGVVINGTNNADKIRVTEGRYSNQVPDVDPGLRKHLNIVSVNGNLEFVNNSDELRINGHEGDDRIKIKNKKGVRDDAATYLSGGAGDDKIWAGRSTGVISGNAGDDDLFGGQNANTMYGGAGDDNMYGAGGEDKMYGGEGDDNMQGGMLTFRNIGGSLRYIFSGRSDDNDTMYGGEGNDKMSGLFGDDKMFGGLGNDNLSGGFGDDKMYGDHGISNKSLRDVYQSLPAKTKQALKKRKITEKNFATYVRHLAKQARAANGVGEMTKTQFADWRAIEAMVSGDDIIDGGRGTDQLFGEGGNDSISDFSKKTTDLLVGGSGNDTMRASRGSQRVYGQAGQDTIIVGGSGSKDEPIKVYPGSGADRVRLVGWDPKERVYGAEAHDKIVSGPTKFALRARAAQQAKFRKMVADANNEAGIYRNSMLGGPGSWMRTRAPRVDDPAAYRQRSMARDRARHRARVRDAHDDMGLGRGSILGGPNSWLTTR